MTPPRHSGFLAAAFLGIVGASAVASCAAPTDFSAISKYSSTMAQSAEAFSTIAADFAKSCDRTQRLANGILEATASAQQMTTLITTTPQDRGVFLMRGTPDPGYTFTPPSPTGSASPTSTQLPSPQPVLDCAGAKSVSTSWSEANEIILGYVQGLGNLAAVASAPAVNPSPFIAGLSSAGLSSEITQPISSLATTLFAYFRQQESARAINSFLISVNPYVPGTIENLEYVDATYTVMLQSEFYRTLSQYDSYIRLEFNTRTKLAQEWKVKSSTSAKTIIAIAQQKDLSATEKQEALGAIARERAMSAIAERDAILTVDRRLVKTKSAVETALASINDKLRASGDYGSAMATVLKTHTELYNASQGGASFADYIKIVQTTGEPIITDLVDLAKAVK